ncbi:MAG: UDP-N-acetylmuramate--L-alanine ligase [Bacteroidetes bacterium]|nr:UDP-N-acetylmuramate--L-alanine ligase [Bacteroidota bacterium]MDA1332866.1 UDP-N-acetylmuramate--L-alanine ligase [Bacteroidota bacterium]
MDSIIHSRPALSSRPRTRRQPVFGRIRHVHLVGIGGIGMSSIAEVLLRRGYRVSGSDLAESQVTRHLQSLGATIHKGHEATHIDKACVVVHSSAVDPATNPETLQARASGIPVIARSEMLAELMRMKFGVGIAGTHGKTTTTTMAGHVIGEGAFDPTVIVGGKVAAFGSNAVSGDGDIILIEADEYDRTFLRLTPVIAVITNIEADHLDCYADLDDIRQAFIQYASSVPFFGVAIVCIDDEHARGILPEIDRRVVTYGTRKESDVRAENIRQEGLKMHFDVVEGSTRRGRVTLHSPGMHSVLNALAAIAVGLELDMAFEDISRGIGAFAGVDRRMHEIANAASRLLIDDYAHHPTEVRATLEAARGAFPERRIVATFQPHLYSRTQQFAAQFGQALALADVVIVLDVYGAREEAKAGVTGEIVAEAARVTGHAAVHYQPDRSNVVDTVMTLSKPGDVILTMGAGDIWRLNRDMADVLNRMEVSHGC